MWASGFARLAGALAGLMVAVGVASSAAADGEAGLVLQEGDTVTTYCIAFEGDGIRGDVLLRAAGHTFDAYGGGSGLAVCSIDDRGCQDASSFSSCFCECQGSNCVYWAFFTRGYGKNWAYSALAFNLLEAKDGDVHGWKWGTGGPNSAPAPQDITFEQICGHAPRGGAAPIPTATVPPPTVAATSVPVATPSSTLPASSITAAQGSPAAPSATPPLVTITSAAPTPTVQSASTPAVPAAGEEDSSEGGNSGALAWFGILAATLVALLGAGLVWRARYGA